MVLLPVVWDLSLGLGTHGYPQSCWVSRFLSTDFLAGVGALQGWSEKMLISDVRHILLGGTWNAAGEEQSYF